MAASSRVVQQRYARCHQEIRIDTNIAGHRPRRTLGIAAGSACGLPDPESRKTEHPGHAQAWSTARRADAVTTATPTATQASLPSRVAVRWHQLA